MCFHLLVSAVTLIYDSLAFEHHGGWVVGIELIKAILGQVRGNTGICDFKVVLFVDLVDFYSRAAVIEFNLRGRNFREIILTALF